MSALTFFKCSPGGNPTLLLLDTGLLPRQQEQVADILLNPLHLFAEQVGFITLESPSLRMAGGEFCVNATRSLGAVLALRGLLHPRPDGMLCCTVQVSGMDSPVQLEVEAPAHARQRILQVAALVPVPPAVSCQPLASGIVLVRLPGIAHVLIDADEHPFSRHWQEDAARIRQRFALEQHDAVGCIWWQKQGESLYMHPIVWVRTLQSACYESSCGSGAMACALMLQSVTLCPLHKKDSHYTIMQPSGTALTLSCVQQEHFSSMRINGPVNVLAEGTVYIESPPFQE